MTDFTVEFAEDAAETRNCGTAPDFLRFFWSQIKAEKAVIPRIAALTRRVESDLVCFAVICGQNFLLFEKYRNFSLRSLRSLC